MILMKMAGKQLITIVTTILFMFVFVSSFATTSQDQFTGKDKDKIRGTFTEGPHVFYKRGKVFVKNILFSPQGVKVNAKTFESTKDIPVLQCKVDDRQGTTFDISIRGDYPAPPTFYPQPEKLFAISDIEGNFDAFQRTLQGNGVIDKKLNWSYGNGHLVLVGDFFDRGHNVTPVLWLVYRLEQQAEEAGGMVHFIIGNHEEMNMRGDVRYVKDRYIKAAKAMKISYQGLYSANTELGRWLRSKNVIEKIGKTIFVHGGLSPEMAQSRIRLEDMNKYARQYYGMDKFRLEQKGGGATAVFGKTGPMWYRGYFRGRLPQKEVDKTLDLYGAKYVVVGHTIVSKVSSLHEGRVIAIDVKHDIAASEKFTNSLYFEGKKMYATNIDGEKMPIETFMTQEILVNVFKAVKEGNTDAVKAFLNAGDHDARINKYYFGKRITLLQAAIHHNQEEVLKMLIEEGANVNMLSDNKTPLMHAISKDNLYFVSILIDYGADINGLNRQKKSPLFYCAKNDNIEIAKVLIENGAKVNIKDRKGRTAAEYALKNDSKKTAVYLKTCKN